MLDCCIIGNNFITDNSGDKNLPLLGPNGNSTDCRYSSIRIFNLRTVFSINITGRKLPSDLPLRPIRIVGRKGELLIRHQ